MNARRIAALTWVSFAVNLVLAGTHAVVGFTSQSWWLINLSVYYALLSAMRFALMRMQDRDLGSFVRRFTGGMLIALSVCLTGTVILCAVRDRGVHHHEVVMICMAVYAFAKITLAVINLIKAAKQPSPVFLCLRNISFADALVSICSLQRSMLVSFGEMQQEHIVLFNILTGSGACIIILLLGLNLIGGKRITMAKSKLVKNIQKIEKTVVDGYKKIEKTFVDGYTKIEDKFVDQYLTRDDETVEEAKARLKKEQENL